MSFYKFILRKLKTADLLLLYTVSLNDFLFSGENFFKINSSVNSYLDFYKVIMETTLARLFKKYCKKLPFLPFHIKKHDLRY